MGQHNNFWRLQEVRIEGLLGCNHVIKPNTEKRVTILHGKNGVGKTAILSLISCALGGGSFIYPRPTSHSFVWCNQDGDMVPRIEHKDTIFLNAIGRNAGWVPDYSDTQGFLELVNRKMSPKSIQWNGGGYEIDRKPISEALSRGERWLFTMLHCLHHAAENSLILIDEPETSLHVEWQRDLLDIFLEVAQKRSLDIIVATHSPYFVGEHTDLLVQLGTPTCP